MRIQVLKDEDETVYQGYYHNQWDTQMGEESFGDNALFFCLFFCPLFLLKWDNLTVVRARV